MADLEHDPFAALRGAARSADVPEPVAVRRRGEQRTRNGRLLAAGAALVVVVVGTGAVLTAGGATETLRPGPIADRPTTSPSSSPVPGLSPAPAPSATSTSTRSSATRSSKPPSGSPSSASRPATRAAGAPGLTVTLTRTSVAGAAHTTYSAHVTGTALQPWTDDQGDAASVPVTGVALTGTDITWGDGSAPGGSDGGAVHCKAGAAVVPVDETFTSEHDYAPGTFTATFVARACGGAGTGTAKVTVATAAPTGPATQLLAAGPVTSAGALAPGYTVGSTVAAESCDAGSDVGIPGAYRCGAGSGGYDPCFPDATPDEVLCVNDPFTRTAARLTLPAGTLPAPGTAGDPKGLWGLVLTGGVRCTALQGAHDQVDGVAVDFSCSDGTLVLRDIDRAGATWVATQARYAAGSYQRLPDKAVTTAYYGRA